MRTTRDTFSQRYVGVKHTHTRDATIRAGEESGEETKAGKVHAETNRRRDDGNVFGEDRFLRMVETLLFKKPLSYEQMDVLKRKVPTCIFV